MRTLLPFLMLLFTSLITAQDVSEKMFSTDEIRIRDPYIFADTVTRKYYMYAQRHNRLVDNSDNAAFKGVEVYVSSDLRQWEAPKPVLVLDENSWATNIVWAPELHAYNGKYYLFATLNSDIEWKKEQKGWPEYLFRGTQVFVSEGPEGPFLPFGKVPHTPMDRMALDGTLWVEDGRPYMIYCHEWVQVIDGTMVLVELAPDLSKTAGEHLTLFNASAAAWSTGSPHESNSVKSYVTDGCFLYRTMTGKLLMIWSSFMNGEYAIGIAESVTGKVSGPWRQQEKPLFTQNGGHGMIFRTFDGRLCIAFHRPNSPGGEERAKFFELRDTGETLELIRELTK